MSNPEHLAILKQGAETWNNWRKTSTSNDIDLSGADLRYAKLQRADLSEVDCQRADFYAADLTDAVMDGADLQHARLNSATLDRARFYLAKLDSADLGGASMVETDFTMARLSNAFMAGTDLRRANLGTSLYGVDFTESDLRGQNLAKAYLQSAEFIEAKLDNAILREANLLLANLSWAELSGADLRGSNLRSSKLHQTDLRNAKLRGADLNGATLHGADLSGADLAGVNLSRASLVGTNLENADLRDSHVYGSSVWDVSTNGSTRQTGLIITQKDQPLVMVDDLEVAQFIYLLLNREKLRSVLNAMTQKGVLILGRFQDGGLEILQAVADEMRGLGYLPMLFDFEPSENRDFTETVKTMVGLARFVIADVSGPSVLKELEATVPDFEVPFIPIIEEGRQMPSMTSDLSKYSWFRWPPVKFTDRDSLIRQIPADVIAPAEEIGRSREQRRASLFPE